MSEIRPNRRSVSPSDSEMSVFFPIPSLCISLYLSSPLVRADSSLCCDRIRNDDDRALGGAGALSFSRALSVDNDFSLVRRPRPMVMNLFLSCAGERGERGDRHLANKRARPIAYKSFLFIVSNGSSNWCSRAAGEEALASLIALRVSKVGRSRFADSFPGSLSLSFS